MKKNDRVESKEVNRAIRRFYWNAVRHKKIYFYLTALLYPPSFFFMGILVPVFVAYGVEAIFEKNIDLVVHNAALVIGVTIIGNILFTIATWAFNRMGTYAQVYISEHSFEEFLQKDYEFFGNNFLGSLGSHIVHLQEGMNTFDKMIFFDIARIAVFTVTGLVMISLQSPLLALITFGFIALTYSYMLLFGKWRLKFRRELSAQKSKIAAIVGDALAHGTTVKSFGSEQFERERLNSTLSKFSVAQLKSWDLFIPNNVPRNILVGLGTAALLIVSVKLYTDDKIGIAAIVLVQLYVIRLINIAVELGEVIKSYDIFMGNAYQPMKTLLTKTRIHDPETPKDLDDLDNLQILFDDVSYRYPDASQDAYAIRGITLDIKPGEKIGIVGYSGSGKTTLTKLLLRFMDPTSGTISLNSVPITDITQTTLRHFLSYVPQEPLLFHRSIKENISYGNPNATANEISDAASAAFVNEFVEGLPMGFDTLVGERGVKLSGGQRQRVAIARALIKNAKILVLDEATSALDSHSESLVQEALWNLMEGRTAIVVAHRLSTIKKLDRIIVMNNGELIEQGTHKELLKHSEIYKELWAHQSGGYIGAEV